MLNVGTEEHKGRAELKLAHDQIAAAAHTGDFEFVGFVEGGDIPGNSVDVIVTDGFTGNVVLKTLEGGMKVVIKALLEDVYVRTRPDSPCSSFAVTETAVADDGWSDAWTTSARRAAG